MSPTGELNALRACWRAGYFYEQVEAFAGWRAFVHSRAPDLSGPLAGVAWWF